jgi:hypothetical protein
VSGRERALPALLARTRREYFHVGLPPPSMAADSPGQQCRKHPFARAGLIGVVLSVGAGVVRELRTCGVGRGGGASSDRRPWASRAGAGCPRPERRGNLRVAGGEALPPRRHRPAMGRGRAPAKETRRHSTTLDVAVTPHSRRARPRVWCLGSLYARFTTFEASGPYECGVIATRVRCFGRFAPALPWKRPLARAGVIVMLTVRQLRDRAALIVASEAGERGVGAAHHRWMTARGICGQGCPQPKATGDPQGRGDAARRGW